MKIIERDYYMNTLRSVMNVPDIKVITGVRRSGKSILLDEFSKYLIKSSKNNNIVRIQLTLNKYKDLRNSEALYDYIVSNYDSKKNNYLLIDEVQLCVNFEQIINSLHDEKKFDIYLTGSNAFLLSSDLATLFGGRVFEIKVYPFSFKEYLSYYNMEKMDVNTALDNYLIKGGFAGSYLYSRKEDAEQYLKSLVRTTIERDLVEKYNLKNEPLLNMISDFLMDNIGNRTSIRNIANTLTSRYTTTNDKTVACYIDRLIKAFLFYPFERYDIKGKRRLESDKKYYLVDTSLRFAILGHKNMDYGRIYENIVALELLRQGYEVYVGVLGNKEIDFVAIKNNIKIYIQVSDDISHPDTLNREISSLLAIQDAYPKILLANSKHDEYDIDGIKVIDIARWLKGVSQFY